MQLIYRGHIYESAHRSTKIHVHPCAVNWRYQPLEKENFESNHCPVLSFTRPRAINWRYQSEAWV